MPREFVSAMETSSGSLVDLENGQLYYEEYGQGEPLVLLHGFGGSGKNWYSFVPTLSKKYRVLVVDLPGHGKSGDPKGSFTHRESAVSIFRLLDHLGIDRFSAMGISSGGMTLLHLATSQPNRINSLVLVSATSHFPDQARTIMRRVSIATMPQEVRRMYDECATRGEAQVIQLTKYFNALGNNYEDMNFTKESLSKITARTLIVHGDRDNFFSIDIPVLIYHSIRNSALWIVPFGDHVPIFELVEEFSTKSLEFLENSSKMRSNT
jgi:pimeloyl-ACP methyl ester carboxylesterase